MDRTVRLRLSRREIEDRSRTLPLPTVCEEVCRMAGQQLGSYLLEGPGSPECARTSHQALSILEAAGYGPDTAASWLFGCNHLLDDQAPAQILREGNNEQMLRLVPSAAWAFVWPG